MLLVSKPYNMIAILTENLPLREIHNMGSKTRIVQHGVLRGRGNGLHVSPLEGDLPYSYRYTTAL